MDAGLIVGLVAAFLTGIGTAIAIQDWRQRRLRPDLALQPDVQPSSTSGDRVKSARVRLVLHNSGKGDARNWRLELDLPRRGGALIKPLNPRDEPPGQSHRQDVETASVEFHAQTEEEVIAAGRGKSRSLGPLVAELPSEGEFRCGFLIWADRIKPEEGVRGTLVIRNDGSFAVESP